MKPTSWVRLACMCCDNARDSITPEELERCSAEGWTDIEQVQSYEDAIRVYDRPEDAPPGYHVTDWFTHLGTCPECGED